MTTNNNSKNSYYCQICQRYFQNTTKEDFYSHKESCILKFQNENLKDNDTSGLNIASFTFGGRHSEGLKDMVLESGTFNNSLKIRKLSEEAYSDNESKPYSIGILNKLGQHNSYISSVLQLLWNMKSFRNHILNELHVQDDSKDKFLYNLKIFFKKYQTNLNSRIKSPIDIIKLRASLAELFQNRRKFMLDKIDDPIDFYFTVMNSLHSHFTNCSLNEITDFNCNFKCFSHKIIWQDLGKIEECQCGAKNKRLYSYHNFVFDIPIDCILKMAKSVNLIEMTKSFKLKSGKVSNDLMVLSDLKDKLFLYYKRYINIIKSSCPSTRCNATQTIKSFTLSNTPSYLLFNLTNDSGLVKLSKDLLKAYILIPKLFELSSLFEHNQKQKVFYEFVGAIGLKNSTSFVSFSRQNENFSRNWVFYDDENIMMFSSYFELISFCLKNSILPIALQYQAIEDKYNDRCRNWV